MDTVICIHTFYSEDKQKIIGILEKNGFSILDIKDGYMEKNKITYIIAKCCNNKYDYDLMDLEKFLLKLRDESELTFFFKQYSS
jgi:K+ transporter